MSRVIGILWAVLVALPLAAPAASPATSASAPVILVFGDSISAGYGIRVEQGWVSLLARRSEQEGYGFRVVNASVSGETTAGGLARLPHVLDVQRPAIALLELGGNDGLRSLPLESTRANLDQMLSLLQQRGIAVLLIGVRLPPNYGERYTTGFQDMFAALARTHRVSTVPLLLDGVDLHPELMQADRIHPNEQGQPLLLDNVWPKLLPLLRARHTGGASHG
jgi:acyl-CoA thioesterase-1